MKLARLIASIILTASFISIASIFSGNLMSQPAFAQSKLANPSDRSSTSQSSTQLVWRNGDRLPIEPVSANQEFLTVQSQLFRDPLELDLGVLNRIDFAPTPDDDRRPTEPFAIQMIDGQTLYGNVLSLDEENLDLESERTGTIKIKRRQIGSLLNLKNSQSIAFGKFNLDQWDAKRGEKKYWRVNEQGHLIATRANTHLYLKSELPESCLIQVEIAWTRKLDFSLALGIPSNSRNLDSVPHLETWSDDLVFSYDSDFELVARGLDPKKKKLTLSLHWDRKKNQVVIHNDTGKLLAKADIGKSKRRVKQGIYLENKTGDLKIKSLAIRSSSAGFDATRTSLQALGQPSFNASLKSFDGNIWLAENDDGEPIEIPGEKFSGVYLLNPAVESAPRGDRIRFSDGTVVEGQLLALKDRQITIQSSMAETPVSLKLDRASSFQFLARKKQASTASGKHQLHNAIGRVRGELEAGAGQGDDILRWRMVGCQTAVPFSSLDDLKHGKPGGARVVLSKRKSSASQGDQQRWRDTLYLKNRDRVPCIVKSMDEENVCVDSFFKNKKIAASLIQAVHFNGGGARSTEVVMNEDGWHLGDTEKQIRRTKWKVKFRKEVMTLKKGATVFHDALMATGGFEFNLKWAQNRYGVLRIRLAADPDSVSSQGASIMLWGPSIGACDLSTNNSARNFQVNQQGAKIKFELKGKSLKVSIDGKKAFQKQIKTDDDLGVGIQLKLEDSFQQNISCRISDVKMAEGSSQQLELNTPRKEYLLTIPRLKVRNLPKQILCAVNRDMVRGELLSMTEQFVMFRSNNVTNRYPRNLLASLIWIDNEQIREQLKEERQASTSEKRESDSSSRKKNSSETKANATVVDTTAGAQSTPQQAVQLLLHGGRRITMQLTRWTENRLVGESQALGKCEVPFDQIYEMRMGTFATQATDVAYSNWVAKLAPKPKLETRAGGGPDSLVFGSSSPLIGTTPRASISLIDGSKTTLKELRGKVVVLDFWATWCGPCVKALPEINAVCQQYASDQLAFYAVNQSESKEQIEAFLKLRELELPVAMDPGPLSDRFRVNAIPQTVVIDRQGSIRFVKVGDSGDLSTALKSAIDQLLAENDTTDDAAAQADKP